MSHRGDAMVVTWRSRGSARRLVFEPRSDGRYDRVEMVLTNGGDWRRVGSEIVESVAVETPDN